MKEAIKDLPVAVGAIWTFNLYDTSLITAIVVGVLTGIYTILRVAIAIRKWWVWEKENGIRDRG